MQVAHAKLDAFYRFIDGPRIAKRSPTPSARTLLKAERLCWREIAIRAHSGASVPDAMDEVAKDSLFWTNVWGEDSTRYHGRANDEGHNDHMPDSHAYNGGAGWSSPVGKSSKGGKAWDYRGLAKGPYGKSGYKGGQKGDGQWKGTKQQPLDSDAIEAAYNNGTYASSMPNGKQSCRNHQKGWCNLPSWESCGRSHGWPQILSSTGLPCNGGHRASFCSRAG